MLATGRWEAVKPSSRPVKRHIWGTSTAVNGPFHFYFATAENARNIGTFEDDATTSASRIGRSERESALFADSSLHSPRNHPA